MPLPSGFYIVQIFLLHFYIASECAGQIRLPLRFISITSSFGERIHPLSGVVKFHYGVDLRAQTEPVFAILDGVVISTGWNASIGNFIRLKHQDLESIYGHLALVWLKSGDRVTSGDFIAVSGNTGNTTGPHLHFALKLNGRDIDPERFFALALSRPN